MPESIDQRSDSAFSIDPRRSLAVTDKVILAPFTLEAVMRQIITTAGVSLTPKQLFNRWWASANTFSGLRHGPACDDEQLRTSGTSPTFNGYSYACPRAEGGEAAVDPFSPTPLYEPVGLFNRFDLAPADGSNCGEYRIVFARTARVGALG